MMDSEITNFFLLDFIHKQVDWISKRRRGYKRCDHIRCSHGRIDMQKRKEGSSWVHSVRDGVTGWFILDR